MMEKELFLSFEWRNCGKRVGTMMIILWYSYVIRIDSFPRGREEFGRRGIVLYERFFRTESYYFPWEWMLNSCFLVLERGYTSGYTSKNVSLPLAEAMPFCSGFRPIQRGSMKGLKEKKGHWQRWWACTGRIRVFVFNKSVINIRKHAIETSAFWFRLAVNARKSWNVFITRNPSPPLLLPDRLTSTSNESTRVKFLQKFQTNFPIRITLFPIQIILSN